MSISKAEKLRDDTYTEMVNILETEGKCAVIRPTGFGKTGILTRLLKAKIYKNPLYLYPAEVIKNTVNKFYYNIDSASDNKEIPDIEFMTNAKFARLEESDLVNIGYEHELIVIDECHKIGGEKTGKNLDKLIEMFPNLKFVGATATPDRTDAIDVIGRYFGSSKVFDYSIHDAFQDEILQKPIYIFCSFARPDENEKIITAEWKKNLEIVQEKKDKLIIAKDLKNKTKEISDLYNMDKVIRRACDAYVDTNYLKFIVFFSNFEMVSYPGLKHLGFLFQRRGLDAYAGSEWAAHDGIRGPELHRTLSSPLRRNIIV